MSCQLHKSANRRGFTAALEAFPQGRTRTASGSFANDNARLYANDNFSYTAVSTNGALGLQTENGPFGNDSMTLAYDAAGRVNSRTVSGTTAETFGFDTLGRMNAHTTDLGSFTYGYLGNSGQVSTRTIGTITTSWGYDTNANDRRLLTISTTGAVARNFTYASNAYQITGITDTPAATHPWLGQSWSFSYDGSDRLLTGNGTIAGNSTFSYDKLDNATSFAGATASYNGLNQITAWNAATHTYDNNGNLTSDGTRTYTYDAADRLKTVTQGGTTTTFAYDGLGRRLKQTVGATETRYLWCGAAICQQRSNTDVVQKRFVAEGEYVLTGTKKYLYLTDHLGSVRDFIDITGTPTLVGSFDYTPYGATARSWGTVTPGYTYAGLFAHTQTGLLLSATRAYEPSKGRWLNKDPIRESGGINMYGYVGGNPISRIDPLGQTQCDIDAAYTVAKKDNPDMKFGAGPPKVDLAADGGIAGLARPTDKNEVIHLNKKYLDTLTDAQLRDLYDTIIHEGLHYTRPVELQTDENGSDHAYIIPEAARRTEKDQSDYNKERHKCGCDQEPLTLSIQRPGLPKINLPKM